MDPEAKTHEKKTLDWKEHPLMVAVGTSVATALVLLTVFGEIVLPVQLAKADFEIEKLRRELESTESKVTKLSGEVKSFESDLSDLREENSSLSELLLLERSESMFRPGIPYPVGLGLVKIGSGTEDIRKWNVGEIDEKSSLSGEYLVVKVENSPVDRVTYYFEAEGNKITHIMFQLRQDAATRSGLLQRELIEAFGEADSNPKPSFFYWEVNGEESIYKVTESSIIVMKSDQSPGFWPRKDES